MYLLDRHKILYFPVPKNGCTTIKKALYFLENEISKNQFVTGIHKINRTVLFKCIDFSDLNLDDYYKFCIVRNPVERFVSIYNGRLLLDETQDILRNKEKVESLNLPLKPSLCEFVDLLHEYRKIPVIKHHTDRQVDFLGDDKSFFDEIYRMGEINTMLFKKLESICGFSLDFDMSVNKSVKIANPSELGPTQLNIIKDFYKEDYEIFGEFFNE